MSAADDATKRIGVEVTKLVIRALGHNRGFDRKEKAQIGRCSLLSAYVSFLGYYGATQREIAAQLREDADRVDQGPDGRFPVLLSSGKKGDPS